MIRALVSQGRGLAIFDDGERVALVSTTAPRTVVTENERTLARLLHGAEDVEPLEIEDLEALARHLELRRDRETLLHATLVLIDGARPGALRELAARAWIDAWAEEVWLWVEGVLLATPAPEGADFAGAAAYLGDRGDVFLQIEALQPAVRSVNRAWAAIAPERFDQEDLKASRAAAVRAGHFGALVRRVGCRAESDVDEILRWWTEALSSTESPIAEAILPGHESKTIDPASRLAVLVESVSASWPELGSPYECSTLRHFEERWSRAAAFLGAGEHEAQRLHLLLIDAYRASADQRDRRRERFSCTRTHTPDQWLFFAGHGAPAAAQVVLLDANLSAQRVRHLLDLAERKVVSRLVFLSACSSDALERKGGWIELLEAERHPRVVFLNRLDDLRCELDGTMRDVIRLLNSRLVADRRSDLPRQRAGWVSVSAIAQAAGLVPVVALAAFREAREKARRAGFNPLMLAEEGDQVRLDPALVFPAA